MNKLHRPVPFESASRMPILVLKTALEHASRLRDCIDVVSRDSHFLASTTAPSTQQLEQILRSSMESASIHFVATDEHQVVGWAQIERGNGTSVAHRGDLGMGVLPAYRGIGLGKRLLSECIAAAYARGINRVELEVRTDNRRALELYRASGFCVESIVKKAMLIDGTYHDAFRMCLITPLSPGDSPTTACA